MLIEKQYTGWQVLAAHSQMARVKREWLTFHLPNEKPDITQEQIMKEPAGEKRDAAILRWCKEVWTIWSIEHSHVQECTDELLSGWFPPENPVKA